MQFYDAVHSDKYKKDELFRVMVNDSIAEYFDSDECDGFYGYLYGIPFIDDEPEKIFKIGKYGKNTYVNKIHDALIDIWGWPGPDMTRYDFKDYGVTWAFTKEEIKQLSKKEWKKYRDRYND